MQIRHAQLRDAPAIAAVHRDSWRDAYEGMLPTAYLRDLHVERLIPRWRQHLSSAGRKGIWIAEDHDQVVGFVKAEPVRTDDSLLGFAGEITWLYVHPTYQGRGVGRLLFETASDALAAMPRYWLVVWVVEANHPARGFYDRLGLMPDGTRRIDRFQGASVSVLRYVGPLNSIVDRVREVLRA